MFGVAGDLWVATAAGLLHSQDGGATFPAVQGINAHIAFVTEAGPLLARTTAATTDALTTFRIP